LYGLLEVGKILNGKMGDCCLGGERLGRWSGVLNGFWNLGHSLRYWLDSVELDLESDDIDYGGRWTETEVGIGECGRMCGSVRARVQQGIVNGNGDMRDCKTEWNVED